MLAKYCKMAKYCKWLPRVNLIHLSITKRHQLGFLTQQQKKYHGRWEPQGDRFWTSKLKQVSTLNNETLLHSTPNSATAERGTSRNWRLESHCHRDRSWIWLVLTIPSTLNTFYCSWTCQTEPVGVLGDCLCTPGRIFICMLVWEMVVLCMYTCIYMWTRVFVLHQPLFSYF